MPVNLQIRNTDSTLVIAIASSRSFTRMIPPAGPNISVFQKSASIVTSAFGLAGCPVRYVAPAPDQTCRQGRGAQAKGSAPPATVDAETAVLRLRAGPTAANAHLNCGADAPLSPAPTNPDAAATEPTQRRTPARSLMRPPLCTTTLASSCIIQANSGGARSGTLARTAPGYCCCEHLHPAGSFHPTRISSRRRLAPPAGSGNRNGSRPASGSASAPA